MNIETVKAVTMALRMSGKCTSRYISAVYVVCFYIEVGCREKVKLLRFDFYVFFWSTLGGSHGIPKVHYKGRQGEYYVMVWSTQHTLYYLISSLTIQLFFNLNYDYILYICRLWTCLVQACGMYGIPQAKREYKLPVSLYLRVLQ